MARKQSKPAAAPAKTVTAERAARLYRLLKILAAAPQTRAALTRRLKLDIRGFYRDLELLRAAGIRLPLVKGQYSLEGDLEDAIDLLPFPDPRLTLGEARQLAKGRGLAHQKLKQQIASILV
ncbi:MAG: hypothetical protein JO112_11290 [Planctomycetes bacterium]|nr:hypothetical protein [Planctomycetota bacterium]